MIKNLLIPIIVFSCSFSVASAQKQGCFKPAGQQLALETDIDFSRYDVFFLGEFHGVYGVSEIKLALIRYLNQQRGISDVFMEIGQSAAWLYNRYLATGDTSLITAPLLPYAQKEPNKAFWRALRAYNSTLQQKITIYGIDFERIEFLKALRLLMPHDKKWPEEIAATLAYIDTARIEEKAYLHSEPFRQQNQLYETLGDRIKEHEQAFEAYYGDNYKVVAGIMFNENTYRNYAQRNRTMYDNLIKMVQANKLERFITVNGMNHGNKAYQGWQSLCYRLENNGQYEGRIASIALLCKNCFDWQLKPEYRYAAYRGPSTYYEDSLLINEIYNKYYRNDCSYTLLPAGDIDDNRVKRFSDYLILMKDQPEY